MKKSILLPFILSVFLSLNSCSEAEREISYRIVETYRIKSSPGSKSHLFVDLPVTYGYQYVGDISVENAEEYSFEEREDYRILGINVKGNTNEKVITVKYDVILLKSKSNWPNETKEKHLNPEKFIDSESKHIRNLANTLKADGDLYRTAKNISRYVSKKIKFDSSPKINVRPLFASEVLENKKGVCHDYANLMTALLRASGIPAKRINGLVLNKLRPSSDWSSPAGSHAWVEFSIDGEWYFADPTWGNQYFTRSDGFHLSYGSRPDLHSQMHQIELNRNENKELFLIGDMTAPISFSAWSEDEKATVTPKVDIVRQSFYGKEAKKKINAFEKKKEKPLVFTQPERK